MAPNTLRTYWTNCPESEQLLGETDVKYKQIINVRIPVFTYYKQTSTLSLLVY